MASENFITDLTTSFHADASKTGSLPQKQSNRESLHGDYFSGADAICNSADQKCTAESSQRTEVLTQQYSKKHYEIDCDWEAKDHKHVNYDSDNYSNFPLSPPTSCYPGNLSQNKSEEYLFKHQNDLSRLDNNLQKSSNENSDIIGSKGLTERETETADSEIIKAEIADVENAEDVTHGADSKIANTNFTDTQCIDDLRTGEYTKNDDKSVASEIANAKEDDKIIPDATVVDTKRTAARNCEREIVSCEHCKIVTICPSDECIEQHLVKTGKVLDYDRPISGSSDFEELTAKYTHEIDNSLTGEIKNIVDNNNTIPAAKCDPKSLDDVENHAESGTGLKTVKFEEQDCADLVRDRKVVDSGLFFRSDSLFVNVDEASITTISGDTSSEICTQYSDGKLTDTESELSDLEADTLDELPKKYEKRGSIKVTNGQCNAAYKAKARTLDKSQDLDEDDDDSSVDGKVVFGLYELEDNIAGNEFSVTVVNSVSIHSLNDKPLADEFKDCLESKKVDDGIANKCLEVEDDTDAKTNKIDKPDNSIKEIANTPGESAVCSEIVEEEAVKLKEENKLIEENKLKKKDACSEEFQEVIDDTKNEAVDDLEFKDCIDIIGEDLNQLAEELRVNDESEKDLTAHSKDTKVEEDKSLDAEKEAEQDKSRPENTTSEFIADVIRASLRNPRVKSDLVDVKVHRQSTFDSDISGCESFYSLDNSCLTGTAPNPALARVKKTLTWTPRILAEERFRNSYSTGTFSDAASFYTADTSGTFYSAREFPLDSYDNFQTCEDFQQFHAKLDEQLEENCEANKSKFSKAKDALVRGKDFVKAKFETYYQRFPGFSKSVNKSDSPQTFPPTFCHPTCGFSCVRAKDISGYSLNDIDVPVGHGNIELINIDVDHLNGGNSNDKKGENFNENKGGNSSDLNKISDKENQTKSRENSDQDTKFHAEKVLRNKNKTVKAETEQGIKSRKNDGEQKNEQVVTVQLENVVGKVARTTCPGVMLKRKHGGHTGKRLEARELVELTDDYDVESEDSDLNFTRDSATGDGYSSEDLGSGSGHAEDHTRQVEKMVVRPTREGTEDDDLPAGYEAGSIPAKQRESTESAGDSQNKKRLRWRSMVEKSTHGNSISSSLTSNNSVEQILYQREMDPELLLNNLGFGGAVHYDDALARIPDRFLQTTLRRQSEEMEALMVGQSPYGHYSPGACMPKPGSDMDHSGYSDIPDGASNQSTKAKGSMQRANFSTVMNSMKFIHGAQMHAPPSPDEETKRIQSIPSILDFPNRRALARQGFYGEEFANKKDSKDGQSEKKKIPPSMSAAEKRRQFQSGVRSRSKNWSLTEEPEEFSPRRKNVTASVDSWDRGFILKSFSDRFSSDSSLEDGDVSFRDEANSGLTSRSSISNLRKQYQETIRQSIDGEYPVFTEDSDNHHSGDNKSPSASITEVRKKQVDRLMLSIDDDGDYVTSASRLSPNPKGSLVLAQKSTQSTIVGSPVTPTDLNFSFDEKTGEESDANGDTPRSNGLQSNVSKSSPVQSNNVLAQQSVSIIVEEHSSPQFQTSNQRDRIHSSPGQGQRSNSNELLLNLDSRSDSCHTLVPQDSSNVDSELSEGDLTPRPGDVSPGLKRRSPEVDELNDHPSLTDALSESASSTMSEMTAILQNLPSHLTKSCDLDEVSKSQGEDKNSLKPQFYPPQESFELEEISSYENVPEDWNGNLHKMFSKRGPMEKSASIQSDSSGFADLDTVGDITPFTFENKGSPESTLIPRQQNMMSHSKPCDQNNSQHSLKPLPVAQQLLKAASSLDESRTIDKSKLFNVSRSNSFRSEGECDKEQVNPTLESIATSATLHGRAVVYTVDIPVLAQQPDESVKSEDSKFTSDPSVSSSSKTAQRYISAVKLNVETVGDTSSVRSSDSSTRIKAVTPVIYRKVKSCDLDHDSDIELEVKGQDIFQAENVGNLTSQTRGKSELNNNIPGEKQSVAEANENYGASGLSSVNVIKSKEDIASRIRSKEALVAAKSQTADWLLNSDRENVTFNIGRPNWASTPNLKHKKNYHEEIERKRRFKSDGVHSFDLLLDEEHEYADLDNSRDEIDVVLMANKKAPMMTHYSVEGEFPSYSLAGHHKPKLQHLAGDSACSSMDESVENARPSLIGSSVDISEDQLNYLRLARLVNGPSQIMDTIPKMPNVKFTPNFHMKTWAMLPKQKLLEEETRLMQHAVQRYKTELSIMENMLFSLYNRVQSDLMPEERADVEELQHLWSQVRKEVIKMEELLSDRLRCVMAGNRTYCPLDSLELIQSMIDLLREQLYHQQMCIARDFSFADEDFDLDDGKMLGCPSDKMSDKTGSSADSTWMSDVSHQMSDLKTSLERAQESQKQELQNRIAELKKSLLSEVRSEMSTTQNTKMLQLQLQARENEVRRLKMELLLQSVNTGDTRRKQVYESDV